MTIEFQDQNFIRCLFFSSFFLPRSYPQPFFPPIFKQILANKIDHWFEITTIFEKQNISETNLPLVNPYYAFSK